MWMLKPLRRKIIPEARGRVLEVGVGTGMNFPYYEQVEWQADRYVPGRDRLETRRGFFVKLSYLWRL